MRVNSKARARILCRALKMCKSKLIGTLSSSTIQGLTNSDEEALNTHTSNHMRSCARIGLRCSTREGIKRIGKDKSTLHLGTMKVECTAINQVLLWTAQAAQPWLSNGTCRAYPAENSLNRHSALHLCGRRPTVLEVHSAMSSSMVPTLGI